VAQRTGAYGLVALGLIALVVTGCGGNSDTGTTGASRPASTTTSQSSTTAETQPTKQDQSSSKSQASNSPASKKKQTDSKQPADEGSSAQGKQGPKPVLPEGEAEPARTPKQKVEGTVANMVVTTPAVDGSGALSRTYTCDGTNTSPPLEWQGVPSSTKELAVFVMNVAPVNGKIFFDWAVAGIPPSTTGMAAGEVPPGAVVGKNSEGKHGYSLCPPGSSGETYVIAVYALEQETHSKQGFDAAKLREEAPKISKSAGLLSAAYGG
jgi:Raf kinase inhibitor-like YbhB/YbcL family protein